MKVAPSSGREEGSRPSSDPGLYGNGGNVLREVWLASRGRKMEQNPLWSAGSGSLCMSTSHPNSAVEGKSS